MAGKEKKKKPSTAINLTRTAGKMKHCPPPPLNAVSAHAQCVTGVAGTRSASCFSILTARDVRCLKCVPVLVFEVAFEKVGYNLVQMTRSS